MQSSPSAIQTQSGRFFDVLTPRASDVDLGDIAHALSHITRYGGHTERFYQECGAVLHP